MKTRIEEMETKLRYVPNKGEPFAVKSCVGEVFICMEPGVGGIALGHTNTAGRVYAFKISECCVSWFFDDEDKFTPLEPLNGEIVFRVKG